jgi:hypothetical protein
LEIEPKARHGDTGTTDILVLIPSSFLVSLNNLYGLGSGERPSVLAPLFFKKKGFLFPFFLDGRHQQACWAKPNDCLLPPPFFHSFFILPLIKHY